MEVDKSNPTREELDALVKHMFHCGANILHAAELALPQIDSSIYSKGTKKDIKLHLSQDIVRTLGLMYPAFDYMKTQLPDFAEHLDRWQKLHEELSDMEAKA